MDDETTTLQNEDEWDFESGEVQRAPRGRRSIVSVGFKPNEFQLVAEAARRAGRPTSQFIREAAVEKARGPSVEVLEHAVLDAEVVETSGVASVLRQASQHWERLLETG